MAESTEQNPSKAAEPAAVYAAAGSESAESELTGELAAEKEQTERETETANQHNLRRLVVSIQANRQHLDLLMAICDNPRYRDEVIQAYETELQAKGIRCHQAQLDSSAPSLKETLLRLEAEGLDPSQPCVVTVLGADDLLSIPLDEAKSAQEKFAFSVQWTRESLRMFTFPIVLWMPERIAQRLTQASPDFWSWRGGVFEFIRPVTPHRAPESPVSFNHFQNPASSSAESIADPAVILQEIQALKSSDPNSPLLASLYRSLGDAYDSRLNQGIAEDYQAEAQAAIDAFKQAIQLQEGTESVSLAYDLHQLAYLYQTTMGRYGEAEALYLQALAIREQQLGANHPDTALSLNNLGLLYGAMGRYEEAEPLFLRSLAIREQQLGPNHPETAISLNNLALLYIRMGRYEQAEQLFLRSIAIKEQQLSTDYISVSNSLNCLGALYRFMGRYSEAEALLTQALAKQEQYLGKDHPRTAVSLKNLAEVYRSIGHYREAEPLYLRSLAIRETQLGPDHPNTAEVLCYLAELYESMGRYAEAEPLSLRSLSIREQQLGSEHPDTALSLNNLAHLYEAMARDQEAEPLYLRALAIAEKSLGTDHPTTNLVRDNLARLRELRNRIPGK